MASYDCERHSWQITSDRCFGSVEIPMSVNPYNPAVRMIKTRKDALGEITPATQYKRKLSAGCSSPHN